MERKMLLNSISFLIFLAIAAIIYYVLPHKLRNIFLLLASYVFYLWATPAYGLLLLATTAVSYFFARALGQQTAHGKRKICLVLGILIPVLILCAFKYYSFVTELPATALGIVSKMNGALTIMLPLGISFYTFQLIGYLIDVYNKKVPYERNFCTYALFISFFPTIIAGPIQRAGELLPQFKEKHDFSGFSNIIEGMQRFLMGAFKKIVIADGLAIFVDGVFNDLTAYKGPVLALTGVFYAIQIYCDFSGYTDMAAGAAKILGFRLRENFNAPYMATTYSGLWQRWHMSLTSWLTDYVFTPLVWSRWYNKLFFGKKQDERKPHIIMNIIIVFLISGLWHGNTINFFIWGLLNGIIRAGEELFHRASKKRRAKKKQDAWWLAGLKRAGVFLTWAATMVFFRAPTLVDAGYFFSHLFLGQWTDIGPALLHLGIKNIPMKDFVSSDFYYITLFSALVIGVISVICIDVSINRSMKNGAIYLNPIEKLSHQKRWAVYWLFGILTAMFYLIVNTGVSGAGQFIYMGY